ncbi:MAG: hypothetical protein IKE69_05805 [Thermoguttaceae bacterium]|nr:hypothetical protein [Thermoguttaceae bacterium]
MKKNNSLHNRSLRGELLEDRLVLSAALGADAPFVSAPDPLVGEAAFIPAPTADFSGAAADIGPLPTSAVREYVVATYYNVKKYRHIDSSMCWAASAANVLAYTKWGYAVSVSGDNPADRLFTNEQEIYDYYIDNFSNGGGTLTYAFNWLVNGISSDAEGWAHAEGDGGALFPGVTVSKVRTTLYASGLKGNLIGKMAEHLKKGEGITASVGWFTAEAPVNRTSGHAFTVWGYTYDTSYRSTDPNYYTGLIVTNSDDATKTLQTIPIEWNEEYSMYHLDHFMYNKGWIENFTCIKPVRLITSVSADGYDGYYDGEGHTVTLDGLEKIGTRYYSVYYTCGGETAAEPPVFTEAGNYSVTVVVVTDDHSAVWSAPVEINICAEDRGKIPAPTITRAVSTGNNTYKVVWDEMPGAVNYELVWSSDGGATWSRLITADAGGTIGGLDYGAAYTCRVRANGDGASTFTGNWSAETTLKVNPVDLDLDGFVGPGDYALLSKAWFSTDGSENWDPRLDVDGDGFIGPGDLSYLSANWFKGTDDADFRYPSA